MKQRILTSIAIVAAIVLMLVSRLATSYIFDILMGCVIIACGIETSKIFSKMGKSNYLTLVGIYPSIAYFVLMISIYAGQNVWECLIWQLTLLAVIFIATFLISLCFKRKIFEEMKLRKTKISYQKFCLKKSTNTLLCMIYPSLPLLMLVFMSVFENLGTFVDKVAMFEKNSLSMLMLVFAFLIPMLADTFAYLSGNLFKGEKLFPSISPKKTISGFVGSIVWTTLIVAMVFLILNGTNTYALAFSKAGFKLYQFALLGFLGAVICTMGDFFESFLKRRAGIKDSGDFLPGHGGVLDRFDSQVFNAPFVFIFFVLLLI